MFWEYQLYSTEKEDPWEKLVLEVSQEQSNIDGKKRSCSTAGLVQCLEHLRKARVAVEAGQR